MTGPDAAVMGCHHRAPPMRPALRGGGDSGHHRSLLRSGGEPIGLAEGMGRNAVAPQHLRCSERAQQRARGQGLALRIPPAARQDRAAACAPYDDSEGAAVALAYRIRIEGALGQDVIG